MAWKQMTPERFQSRDVTRRISKLERQAEYRNADLARIVARLRALDEILGALGPVTGDDKKP